MNKKDIAKLRRNIKKMEEAKKSIVKAEKHLDIAIRKAKQKLKR